MDFSVTDVCYSADTDFIRDMIVSFAHWKPQAKVVDKSHVKTMSLHLSVWNEFFTQSKYIFSMLQFRCYSQRDTTALKKRGKYTQYNEKIFNKVAVQFVY